MAKRKTPLTETEREIVDEHHGAYLHGHESADLAIEKAVLETREHVLKTFERHIGGDPTAVFADVEAKGRFRILINTLRGQR